MDERTRLIFHRLLGTASDARKARAGVPPAPLLSSAQLLYRRALSCAERELAGSRIDADALEAACFAMMLPFMAETAKFSSIGVMPLSDRCSQAAELLFNVGNQIPEDLLEHTASILADCPRKATRLAEARVLADAINIEDFGLGGICRSASLLLRPGFPVADLVTAYDKRDQYGYWDARLRDGFHFPSTRVSAQQRLRSARGFIRALHGELQLDPA